MPTPDKYLVVIAGPTAVGKTELAIRLAEHFNSEIISADSRQFYREMNIGTAKPTPEQLNRIPHHFIDNKSVDELYGAGHFEKDVKKLLTHLFEKHQLVFLVGGSGLYINAILEGIDDFIEVPLAYRDDLNQQFREKGINWLRQELAIKDKAYYNRIDLHNPQRIIRALEVCNFTGQPYSSFLNRKREDRPFISIPILVTLERRVLYEKINNRVDDMMRSGLLDEVRSLKAHRHQNALKTVGYKELNAYLEGDVDLKTAVEKIKQHTRNYAKRQLTWFRHQGHFKEFDPDDIQGLKTYIHSQLS